MDTWPWYVMARVNRSAKLNNKNETEIPQDAETDNPVAKGKLSIKYLAKTLAKDFGRNYGMSKDEVDQALTKVLLALVKESEGHKSLRVKMPDNAVLVVRTK
jgi:hypothetical protein